MYKGRITMKLLIVDDEELTRQGLIQFLDWNSLGILQIFEAEDGVQGLKVAAREKPDIILCDVRMPRMDGIQMLERLKNLLPGSAFIFMSGYSDKEYLKAAIRLKAVRYVEKPLNPIEVREAVREACSMVHQDLRTRQNELLHSRNTASALATLLTRSYKETGEAVEVLVQELQLSLTHESCFTSFIISMEQASLILEPVSCIMADLEDFLSYHHMQAFHVSKQLQFSVIQIMSPVQPSEQLLIQVGRHLAGLLKDAGAFYISRGDTVTGISKAYDSYVSAVTLMQSSFFFCPGTILTAALAANAGLRKAAKVPPHPQAAFLDALLEKDPDKCEVLLNQIYDCYDQRCDVFPHEAKDLYYKLFMSIEEGRQQLRLSPDQDQDNIMKFLEHCFSFRQLQQKLLDKTMLFFESVHAYVPENSTIFMIKEYINAHYGDESLSVQQISQHAFLSPSYVCTYFKNETGQTLNQYLTNFRMEKAKQLLQDPRYQIADISAKVGYSNGNYFGKSFKKMTGLSPSEYREKMMR